MFVQGFRLRIWLALGLCPTVSVMAAPIHDAVMDGDRATLEQLLDEGADIDARDDFGYTALHIAVATGNIALAELLIERFADVNLGNELDVSPLTTATLSGYQGIARLLERSGAIAGPEVRVEQVLASSEYISSGGLAALCSSTLEDSAAFCDGYVRTVLHFRKRMASCMSEAPGNQAYCEGAGEASQAIMEEFESCPDCDFGDISRRLVPCVPSQDQSEEYCDAYNAELESETAMRAFLGDSPETWGVSQAGGEMVGHGLGGDPSLSLRNCVTTETPQQALLEAFLEFVAAYPSERRGTAFAGIARAQLYQMCDDLPPGARPHLELCTDLRRTMDRLETTNTCDEAVVLIVDTPTRRPIERTLDPGEAFGIDVNRGARWLSTSCPVGYESTVPISEDNRSLIAQSLYSCIPVR
jgi:hypothetical protein